MLKNRLDELRTEKGLTKKEVAEYLKIDQSTYGKYELGKREPDNTTVSKLADLFNVSTDYLLCRTNNRTPINDKLDNDEVEDILESLHKRPEMKALFSISKNATKEDIEKTLKIIEALKND